MSRPIHHRLLIDGRLVAESPVHVGGMPDDLETDMPLARDGLDRPYVPGTSLAGPLRAWMEERFPGGDHARLCQALWGDQPASQRARPAGLRRERQPEDQGAASRILIDDGAVSLPAGLDLEVWDGVGIDRESGSAARDIKFDRTLLPVGTTIALSLQVELPTDSEAADPMRAMLGHLLEALEQCQVAMGAATTRGLGRLRLHDLRIQVQDWSGRDGVLAILKREARPGCSRADLQAAASDLRPRSPARLRFRIHWRPAGPLMSKAAHEGVAVDVLPMVSGRADGRMGLVLPGSGIKGALRSQAERIVRTLLGRFDGVVGFSGRRRHLSQLDVPLVAHLFGSAKPPRARNGPGGRQGARAGRSALRVATTYARDGLAEPRRWAALADAVRDEDQGAGQDKSRTLRQALADARLDRPGAGGARRAHLEQATHVAVDRWTGGAAENLLYSAIEPYDLHWEPIELTLEIERLPEPLRAPALALLLLTLRDLAQGRITLGYGANRGYGALAVERTEIRHDGDDEAAYRWLDGIDIPSPFELDGLDAALLERLRRLERHWQDWIDAESADD